MPVFALLPNQICRQFSTALKGVVVKLPVVL